VAATKSKRTLFPFSCAECGQPGYYAKGRPPRVYCSRECTGAAKRGVTNGRTRTMIDYTCGHCGEARQFRKGAPRTYCSTTCSSAAKAARVEIACAACGMLFSAKRWMAESDRVKYCSAGCYRDRDAKWFQCVGCQSTFRRSPRDLRKGNVSHCSMACKRRNGWGTKTPKVKLLRASIRARKWRAAVLARDNYTCQICGLRGVPLHADHIKPWARYPKLRFELTNGRALCVPCHRATPTYGRSRRIPTQPVLFALRTV
jgi:5-methylcytosine-specific restriction endonuclease McrA